MGVFASLNAQNLFPDYAAEWALVDTSLKHDLPKTALEQIKAIRLKAENAQNPPQMLKALLREMEVMKKIPESKDVEANPLFFKTIERYTGLAASLANFYAFAIIAENIRYSNEKSDAEFNAYQPGTWSQKQQLGELNRRLNAIVADSMLLRSAKPADFKALLTGGEFADAHFLDMYRVVIFRLVDLLHSSYKIGYLDSRALSESKNWFCTADELKANRLLAFNLENRGETMLALYRRLLLEAHKDPLSVQAYFDIERLKRFYGKANFDEKNDWYREALDKWIQKTIEDTAFTLVSETLADYWYRREYNKNLPETRWHRRRAIEILQVAIRLFPDCNGAKSCQNQLNRYTRPEFDIATEETYLPGKPFMFTAGYNNVKELFFRIIPMPFDSAYNLSLNYGSISERAAYLRNLKPLKEFSFKLPDAGDFHTHSVELFGEALPEGNYLMLIGESADFDTLKILKNVSFRIQGTSITEISGTGEKKHFLIADFSNGNPMSGVKVQKVKYIYNKDKKLYDRSLLEEQKSDKNGILRFDSIANSGIYLIVNRNGIENIFNTYDGKSYEINDDEDNYDAKELKELATELLDPEDDIEDVYTAILTDRSLYRPGQTIYFKGIMYLEQREGKDYRILPNQKSRVYLEDPNENNIAQVDITTNEFGSFQGSFIAPAALPGGYQINAYGSSAYIKIEEYKRPQFYVETEELKGQYSIGSAVELKGKARAYAGNTISGAKVKYKVYRQAAVWLRYWDGYFENKVISEGSITTDSEGNFIIPFIAAADPKVKESLKPDYRFTIEIDVTDANGETRSKETTLTVGYRSLLVSMEVPGRIPARGDLRLKPICTNLNNQPLPFTGSIIIEKLQTPARPMRSRKWGEPDTFVIAREKFKALFPDDPWMDDNLFGNLPVQKVMMVQDFEKDNNPELFIADLKNWEPGIYRVTLRADDGSLTQKEVEHLQLLPADAKKPAVVEALTFIPEFADGQAFEPGQKAKIRIGSVFPGQKMMYWVDANGKFEKPRWITVSNSAQVIDIPVTEKNRGGIDVHALMVRDGRHYYKHIRIHVPWTQKQLKVEAISFRDKLSPGQQESWTLKISGQKAQAAAAELCAVLYDASLDQIYPHGWSFFPWQLKQSRVDNSDLSKRMNVGNHLSYRHMAVLVYARVKPYSMPVFGGIGEEMYYYVDGVHPKGLAAPMRRYRNVASPDKMEDVYDLESVEIQSIQTTGTKTEGQTQSGAIAPPPRRNFNETAFFFPQLKTDNNGEVTLQFTLPESLTRWKLMALAHDKKLAIGLLEKTAESAKELMVQPNIPRFFTETDSMGISSRVVNNSGTALQGTYHWQISTTAADTAFISGNQPFSLAAGETKAIAFGLRIPERGAKINSGTYAGEPLLIKVWAVTSTASHHDGEEHIIPVLSKKVLLHATLPVYIKGAESGNFRFTEMEQAIASKTAVPQSLTMEFSSNPAWAALKALPTLMEFPHQCAEQTFNRWYAVMLAAHIVKQDPRIQMMVDNWKKAGKKAPKSPLEENPELKDILLNETPWVAEARTESERMARLGDLFDENRLSEASQTALQTLMALQNTDGGFPWFAGGSSNATISFYLLAGLERMQSLGLVKLEVLPFFKNLEQFTSRWLINEHQRQLKAKNDAGQIMPSVQVYQALYALSLLHENGLNQYAGDSAFKAAIDFWYPKAVNKRAGQSLMLQSQLAITAWRTGDKATAQAIIKTLREYAIKTPVMGMYWPRLSASPYWHSAPIESHAAIIEAFKTIDPKPAEVEAMRQWLLRHKETNGWGSTKATAEVCHALLGNGKALQGNDRVLDVVLGDKRINPKTDRNVEYDAGTGYFKFSVPGAAVTRKMAQVEINSMPIPRLAPPEFDESIATGALHFHYFEDAEMARKSTAGLSLTRRHYREEVQDGKAILVALSPGEQPVLGTKIITRLIIEADRDYEFLHLKDPRAAGMEPMNNLSGQQWSGALGYYLAIRDAATHFFIDDLRKGKHTLEYSQRVFHAGQFVLGPATIRSMYAPAYGAGTNGMVWKTE